MTSYLIRVDGVNFDRFIGDTEDLSTVRGAGLAMLRAPQWLAERFPDLEPVSLGASSGLFAIELEPGAGEDGASAIAELCEQLRGFLREHRHAYEDARGRGESFPLELATFVVDAIEAAPNEFALDRRRLLAMSRFRQLRQPSLHLVAPIDERPLIGVCNLGRLRPAVQGRLDGEGRPISESVWQRRELGRAEKQAFYQAETGESFPGFSQSFEDLARGRGRGNLDAKMAVIYLDANHLSKLQNRLATSPDRLRAFDDRLREKRREILREILVAARDRDPAFREGTEGEGPIRFETLLWGGDDLLWVAPAWRGLAVLAAFYERAAGWQIELPGAEAATVTHGAGIVFCHRGAPISRIRRLAEDLARQAKADRERDLVAYQVLESFDHTGEDLAAFRRGRTPAGCGPESLLLDGARLGEALELAPRVRDEVPHRKVLELARILLREGAGPSLEAVEKKLRSDLEPRWHDPLDRLLGALGDGRRALGWLHLAELWDFLEPAPAAEAAA